jgi:hypothetical protein
MKTYSLSIVDSEGEIIMDRDISPDEVIDILRNAEPVTNVNAPEKPVAGKKVGGIEKKQYSCKNCGQPGHTSKTCPKAKQIEIPTVKKDEPEFPNPLYENVFKMVKGGLSKPQIGIKMHDSMTQQEIERAINFAEKKLDSLREI